MTDYFGYEAMVQAACRGVVREALRRVADAGALPGNHHFYITFRTKAPGVKIADQLVERFPEDITIVIQHQFWDLEVSDTQFEVILKFSGVPQHLTIPFAAITRFVDPSVGWGLPLESPSAGGDGTIIDPVLTGEKASDQAEPAPPPAAEASGEATVVKLDAFRRK